MPAEPVTALAASTSAFAAVLLPVQAVLFLALLAAVAVCDCKHRALPDSLHIAIAALTILQFSPQNLLGLLGALPFLGVPMALNQMERIGGGDIKLVAAIGLVLGLSASLAASMLGLGVLVVYVAIYAAVQKVRGRTGNLPFPLCPSLAAGAAAAYFMKMGGFIT